MSENSLKQAENNKKSAFVLIPQLVQANKVEEEEDEAYDENNDEQQQDVYYEMEPPEREAMQENEGERDEEYYCMTCQQKYNFKISLCNHSRRHKLKFKCSFQNCSRRFAIESGLERHKLTHTGEKPYQCDFDKCQQKFNQKSNLNRHKRIHQLEKPFICEKCCKSFTTTTNLKQHTQVHFEDKERRRKYVCEIKGCDKEYLYMCNLKKHKQEHEDPMADYFGEKKLDFHSFSMDVGSCRIKVSFKKGKEHSENVITYRPTSGAIMYQVNEFTKIVQCFTSSQMLMQEQENGVKKALVNDLEQKLSKIFEKARDSLSVCMQIHQSMETICNLILKSIIHMGCVNSFKSINMVVSTYDTFKDMVKHILDQYPPPS